LAATKKQSVVLSIHALNSIRLHSFVSRLAMHRINE
jgi:hypothetical protein